MEELILKLKNEIIEVLNLEDIKPEDIDENAPLFGGEGLGLDSIDALELIVLMEKNYGIKLQDPNQGKDIFKSINNFANSYLAFNANARIAILWNNGPWFSGVQGVFFYYQSGNGKVVNRNILGTTYVFLGFNF